MASRQFSTNFSWVKQTGTTDSNGCLRISTVGGTYALISIKVLSPAQSVVTTPMTYLNGGNLYWGVKLTNPDGSALASTSVELNLAYIPYPVMSL